MGFTDPKRSYLRPPPPAAPPTGNHTGTYISHTHTSFPSQWQQKLQYWNLVENENKKSSNSKASGNQYLIIPAFRDNVRLFLDEYGEKQNTNNLWSTLLLCESNGAVFRIYVLEECLDQFSEAKFCDYCKVVDAAMGGDLMFVKGVTKAHAVWFGCRDKELGNHLPKRIVVFAGGVVYEEMREVQLLGKEMKDRNVACDVISFGDPAIDKHQHFKTLIDAADNNGNCNLLHVPPKSTVRDALFRSHVGGSRPLASSVHQESSKPHKKAAARYSESLDLHDHPAKINA